MFTRILSHDSLLFYDLMWMIDKRTQSSDAIPKSIICYFQVWPINHYWFINIYHSDRQHFSTLHRNWGLLVWKILKYKSNRRQKW